MNTHRTRILVATMILTFLALRVSLHLFTGLLLIVAGGIPVALFPGASRVLDLATITFGAGLALTLDEWVYLIVTDGSNASYILPVSLKGGVLMVALATLYVMLLYMVSRNRS